MRIEGLSVGGGPRLIPRPGRQRKTGDSNAPAAPWANRLGWPDAAAPQAVSCPDLIRASITFAENGSRRWIAGSKPGNDTLLAAARMERGEIRDGVRCRANPDCASLHPGYRSQSRRDSRQDSSVNQHHPAEPPRKPIHHSPVFWIGLILCLAAIAIYIGSEDLSWLPGRG